MTEPLATPRKLAAGRGADWLSQGFDSFRAAPGPWLAVTLIWIIGTVAIQHIAGVGSLLANLLTPVVIGGLMLGCDAQTRGEPFRLEHLWAGFASPRASALLMLGVLMLLASLAIGVFVVLAVGASVIGSLIGGGGLESVEVGTSAALAGLILLLLVAALSMAMWFAPALVVLQGLAPTDALKASFRACLVNPLALLVNGLLMLVIAILALIPLGLGLLVAVPVFVASVYFGYRDIFAPMPAA